MAPPYYHHLSVMALGLRRGPPKQASPLAYLALRPGKRSASTLAQFNHERWTRDPQVVRLVSEIRSHYFPRPPRRDRRTSDEEQGLPLSKALEGLLQLARQDATLTPETAMVIQAKCRLAGENANGVRGVLSLPHTLNVGTRILVLCPEAQWGRAKAAGAAIVGSGELVDDILEGKLHFDRCLATTDQMSVLARLARILGPQGLMPNVKTGTLTTDVEGAIRGALANTPFRIDRETALFRLPFARLSWGLEEARANLRVIMEYLSSQNKTTDDGRFVEAAALMIDPIDAASGDAHTIHLAKSEYGQSTGPKFMVALLRLRAQAAAAAAAAAARRVAMASQEAGRARERAT